MATKYLAIVENSYHVEGDERSKTNPGHGYPAHTVCYGEAIEFDDEDEMKEWVAKEEGQVFSKREYRIFKCDLLEVNTTISIDVSTKKVTNDS